MVVLALVNRFVHGLVPSPIFTFPSVECEKKEKIIFKYTHLSGGQNIAEELIVLTPGYKVL